MKQCYEYKSIIARIPRVAYKRRKGQKQKSTYIEAKSDINKLICVFIGGSLAEQIVQASRYSLLFPPVYIYVFMGKEYKCK